MIVPPPPRSQSLRSDDFLFCLSFLFSFFFACQLVPPENEDLFLGEDFCLVGSGGGG